MTFLQVSPRLLEDDFNFCNSKLVIESSRDGEFKKTYCPLTAVDLSRLIPPLDFKDFLRDVLKSFFCNLDLQLIKNFGVFFSSLL